MKGGDGNEAEAKNLERVDGKRSSKRRRSSRKKCRSSSKRKHRRSSEHSDEENSLSSHSSTSISADDSRSLSVSDTDSYPSENYKEKKSHSRKRHRHCSSEFTSSETDNDTDADERDRKRSCRKRHEREAELDKRDRHRSSKKDEKRKHREKSRRDEKRVKKKKKVKKDKWEKDKKGKAGPVTDSWGKYGIIKEIDMWSKRPEFSAWLAEVKKVNLETMPAWEEKQMFKEYMEDFNTATLAKKYYDLDAYHRRKFMKAVKKGFMKQPSERTEFNDEEQRRQELKKEREMRKEAEVEALKRSMQGGMAQAMKEQAQLREEMQYQYRLGNFEAANAIQRRLDPAASSAPLK